MTARSHSRDRRRLKRFRAQRRLHAAAAAADTDPSWQDIAKALVDRGLADRIILGPIPPNPPKNIDAHSYH